MGEAVYVVDRDMTILYCNPAAEALTGHAASEIVGRLCSEIFCEASEFCQGKCPPRRAILHHESVLHRDAETRTRKGYTRQTQLSVSPFFSRGECVGAVIVLKDITDLKRAEHDRERLIGELRGALSEVKQLSGLLPICASCKKIRDDQGYWNQIEEYIRTHTEAEFSHSICPDCVRELYPNLKRSVP